MATLTENITRVVDDFDDVQNAIIEKGVDIPYGTPTNEYGNKIREITSAISDSSGLWTRPIDRPEKPVILDNTILMLFGVSEKSPNDMAFNITTSLGIGYTVDWGDGEVINYNSGIKAEHVYEFGDIDKSIDNQGYKMVWITIRPTIDDVDIITFNTQQRPSLRSTATAATFVPQLFELYIKCSRLTSMIWRGVSSNANTVYYSLLDIFALYENNITTTYAYMLASCFNLKMIEEFEINNISSLSSFMSGCYSYNYPFPDNVTFDNVTTNFMSNCSAYNQPFSDNVTFKNITTNFMTGCMTYNQPFPDSVTFSNVTSDFMSMCYAYNQPFPDSVIFGAVTTNFMNSCTVYNHSVIVDLRRSASAIGTSFIGIGNYALKGLRLLNMGTIHTALTISNSSLDVDALIALFNDLPDRIGLSAGTITISNCYGAPRLTSANRLIATSKNWNITG